LSVSSIHNGDGAHCNNAPVAIQRKAVQRVEKAAHLTRPTPARRDAPFSELCSRIAQRLNVPK
jgi:hypothetical protein